MDASIVQFTNLFRNGSSHIFNCRDLTHKIEVEGGEKLLFKTKMLNRAVFLKLPVGTQQSGNKRDIIGGFETKVYLPFENGLEKGGQAINFSDKNFNDVISGLRSSNTIDDHEDMLRDQLVLQLIESLPSLDPFLLKEKLFQLELDVDEKYFSLTDEAWREIRAFVMSKFRPMIGFAYPTRTPNELQVAKLTEMLWEAKDNPDVRQMMSSLSVPPELVSDVLYSWKGIIYYEYVYTKSNEKIKSLLMWLDQIGNQLGGLTTSTKERRNKIRAKLSENIAAMLPILRDHKIAYDELFVHKKNAQPFVSFLSQCSKQFWSLSRSVGQMMVVLQIWQDFNLRTNPSKANLNQINNFFDIFEQNII
jgi:hypothetical protein